MKTIKSNFFIFSAISFVTIFSACKKENSISGNTSANSSAVTAAAAIAVSVDSASNDSIYVIGTCDRGQHLDSLAASSLPASVTEYLNTNYAGYTFQKAFTANDPSGNVAGYVVVVLFNGTPVGLKFDASGTFVKVLEQREGHDLLGKGWHEGGRFGDRDGRHADTVSMSSLPAGIASYYATNYPADTLVKAYINRDSSYLVFSINNGVYASVFKADGTLVNRQLLQNDRDNISLVAETSLPAPVTSYLTATYPNYVFKQAFSYTANGSVAGYIVCIDANGTRYALQFDAAGNFIKLIAIK